MKNILSTSGNASIGSRSYYGLSTNGDNAQNVFDVQRASNFSALQALKKRHLDVVRLQLQEEDETYHSRMV